MAAVVRVELLGGLGNQLFQAAAGLALANRLNARLEFDLSRFRKDSLRSYALGGLGHKASLTSQTPSRMARLTNRTWRTLSFGRAIAPVWWPGRGFREATYAFDPRFERIDGSCYLSGYFHSEKYFLPYADQIRQSLSLEPIISQAARDYAPRLGGETLAVHVRIGDFKSASAASQVHGTLDPSYYRQAIALACAAKPVTRIYVFSDTPEAVRELMPPNAAYEIVKGFAAADDLYLMAQARHHIIANSTFSWWSAWFDPRPDKLVICPRAWLAPETLKRTYIGDLYPNGWITL